MDPGQRMDRGPAQEPEQPGEQPGRTPRIGLLAQAPGAPLTSSAWIRLLLPLGLLQRQEGWELLQLPPLSAPAGAAELPAELDGLIVQRAACPSLELAECLLSTCRQRRIPVLLDLDDALFALPEDHPERQRYGPMLPALDRLLAAADLRVFSTANLAELCRQRLRQQGLNPGPDVVVPNGLDAHTWAGKVRFPQAAGEGPLQLLYMGSRTHAADLAPVLDELDHLAGRQAEAFRLTLIGGMESAPRRPWLEVLDVPLEARRYPRFVRWLRQHLPRHDLGLAPLATNPFNAAKSDVKLLDYAALGLPSLCSPGPAYQQQIDAGLALAAPPGHWAERVTWAARHRRQLRRLAQAAHHQLDQQRSSARTAATWAELLRPLARPS
jgi:hypothetical protein